MTAQDPHPAPVDFSSPSQFGLRGRLISNTGLLGGARLAAALMGVATLIIAAKALPNNAAFGTLLFIHAYMLFFSEIASFHIWQALIRFGSIEVKAKNARRLGALIKTGLLIDMASAVAAFIAAVLLFNVFLWAQSSMGLASSFEAAVLPDGLSLKKLIIGYCSVILFRQINVATGLFRLFDKFSILALRTLVMPMVRLFGVIIAAHQGWGLIGFVAIWFLASLLSYLTLQFFAIFELHKRGFWPIIRREKPCKPLDFPGFFSFVFKTNIDTTINSVRSNFPSLAIMLAFGPAIVAIYRIAEEIARLLSRAVSLFDQVLFPELSRMAVDMDFKTLSKTASKAALGIAAVGTFISAVMLLFGDNILKAAFNESFTQAAPLSILLLIASSLIGIATPFYTVFYVLMRPGTAIWVRLTGALIVIGLFFALSRSLGIFSIGWAAIAGAIIEVALVIVLTRNLIKKSKASSQNSEPPSSETPLGGA